MANKSSLPDSDMWVVRAERGGIFADYFLSKGKVVVGWGEAGQILEDHREEFRDVALNAVNEIAETSRRGVEDIQQVSIASIEEMQQAGIDGVQKVVDAVSGIPEKLDNIAEKVNRLIGAYDLGKWVAAIVLGGLGYGIYHISDKLSEIVSVLGELANG